MADNVTFGIRVNGGERDFQKPRLVLKDGNYRWWSTNPEQMLREMKAWEHVQGAVPAPGPILILGASATPAISAVPAIVAAMGVAEVPSVPAVAANASVT